MEHGAPSANGSLNDLQSVTSAFRGWGEKKEGEAAAPAAGSPTDSPTPGSAQEPEQDAAQEGAEHEAEQPQDDAAEHESQTEPEPVFEVELEDGKTERFTASELRANILRQRDYTRKTQELAEGRRIVEAKAAEVGSRLRGLQQTMDALAAQVKGEDTSSWEELRRTDPSEWSARMLERQHRMASIHAAQQTYQAEMARAREETYRREAEILREKIPAWKDNAVASREYGELLRFTSETYGLTPDDLESVSSDHRFVLLARDAMQGREVTRKIDARKEQVRRLPRVQQPGASGNAEAAGDVAYKRSIERLRATGGRNTDDVAAAFKALGERRRR